MELLTCAASLLITNHTQINVFTLTKPFQSNEKCEHLINLGKPHMKRSKMANSKGQGIISRSRTSSAMFLERGKDKIIQDTEKRIADVTSTPIENGEGLQILHYEVNQHFVAHFDYNHRSDVVRKRDNIYGKGKSSSEKTSSKKLWSQGTRGLSVKPKMGNALLFWSMKPDGTRDPASIHSASPVIKGNKWSCTKWLQSAC